MGSILNKLFGRRGGANGGRGAPAVHLAAFGKHPAWNDFLDDIGLDTQRLIDVKRLLFQGIDANIAAWERLEDRQRLKAFKHVFVWLMDDAVVVGRMWASSDGKGRTRYPMIACAECSGLPLGAVLRAANPALSVLEQGCVKATAKAEVAAAVDAARKGLRRWAASAPAAAEDVTAAAAADRLARCPDLPEPRRALVGVLYHIEQEAPHHLLWARDGGGSSSELRAGVARPAHVRLPACADTSAESTLLWSRFLSGVVAERSQQLLIFPIGQHWVDLIVGEPTGPSLYCLRAAEKGMPLTTSIPYNIDEDFARRANQLLDPRIKTGPPPLPGPGQSPAPAPPAKPNAAPAAP